MKRSSLVLLAFIAGCGGSSGTGESTDASNETGPADAGPDFVAPDVDAAPFSYDASETDGPDPCAKETVPPSTLACTGLYVDFPSKLIAPNAMEYTPATPLWSDGAQKQRWIVLPPNSRIDISDPNEWKFPVGTKLFKEFRVDGQRVETRMFQKADDNFWNYATYAWNRDETSAAIHYGGPVPVGDAGATWNIPTNDDCNECHRGRRDRILGFEQVSLGRSDAQGLTLARLAEMGLVTPAPARTSLSIGDDGTGLAPLALGWIHVNCGVTCHNANPSAAGYGAGMILRLDPADLDGSPPNAATWNILKTTVGVPCVSGSVLGRPRIQPGDVAASVIHELISERGTLQMPPIATRLVDTTNVAVVASWIRSLPNDAGVATVDAGPPDSGAPPGDEAGSGDESQPDAGDEGSQAPEASDIDADMSEGDMPGADNQDGGATDESSNGAQNGDDQPPDAGDPGVESPDAGPSDDAGAGY